MKERPILFSAPMVQAILAGKKSQTRRVVKGRHHISFGGPASALPFNDPNDWGYEDSDGYWHTLARPDAIPEKERATSFSIPCPYGQPGDLLWVRETWQAMFDTDNEADDAPFFWHEFPAPKPTGGTVRYRATDHDLSMCEGWRWNPAIHMPRWAARLTLRVVSVRVERLHDITEADAQAEGVAATGSHTEAFSALWDTINGPRGYGWDANCWVWVVEFEVVK